MNSETKALITTIICFAIIGVTIVGGTYVAYNPKVCPLAEQHKESGE